VNGASPVPSEAKTEAHGTERPNFGTQVSPRGPIPATVTSLQPHRLQGNTNTPAPDQNPGSHPSTPVDLTAVPSESSGSDDEVDEEVVSEHSFSTMHPNESLFGDPGMQNKRKQLEEVTLEVASERSLPSAKGQNAGLFGGHGTQNNGLSGGPGTQNKRKQSEEESKEPEAKKVKTEERIKTEEAR
jgi:hypothetical protein